MHDRLLTPGLASGVTGTSASIAGSSHGTCTCFAWVYATSHKLYATLKLCEHAITAAFRLSVQRELSQLNADLW